MVIKDFHDLKYEQMIWFEGVKEKVTSLEYLHNPQIEKSKVRLGTIFYYWDEICADCSLEKPVEKTKYYYWEVKSVFLDWVLSTHRISENGYYTSGDKRADWDKKEKKRLDVLGYIEE